MFLCQNSASNEDVSMSVCQKTVSIANMSLCSYVKKDKSDMNNKKNSCISCNSCQK